MKIRVELQKTVTLDARDVEASSAKEAEEKAYMTFHKYDRNDAEMVNCYCAVCDSLITEAETCDCQEDDDE